MPIKPLQAVAVLLVAGILCLSLSGCAKRPRSAGEIRESANNAYARGDYAKSLEEWEAYAEIHPVPLASDLGRGKALLALGRPGDAIIPLERVYRDDPMNEEKLQLLIQAFFSAGEHERLISLLRDRTRQPGTVEEYLRLGRYAEEIGDADEAERALLAAARVDRGLHIEPQMKLAEFYHGIGDTEKALERYAMALWFDYTNLQVGDRIRALGETPGRTFVRVPQEAVEEGILAPDAAPPEPATGG
jgi:tetratricopeptide (TPR) repeat protein